MQKTDSKYSVEDIEAAGDVIVTICQGADYWARLSLSEEKGRFSLTLAEIEGDARGTITSESLLEWLAGDGPAALIQQVGPQYHRAAIAGLAARDWDADYDAETADVIAQAIVLGGLIYG